MHATAIYRNSKVTQNDPIQNIHKHIVAKFYVQNSEFSMIQSIIHLRLKGRQIFCSLFLMDLPLATQQGPITLSFMPLLWEQNEFHALFLCIYVWYIFNGIHWFHFARKLLCDIWIRFVHHLALNMELKLELFSQTIVVALCTHFQYAYILYSFSTYILWECYYFPINAT